MSIPIVVLAAGAASRMRGQDKLLLGVGGEPLLRRCLRRALAAARGPVVVALPPAPHPRHAALAGLGAIPVEVPDAGEGINASLRAAIARLPAGATAAMILLADLPDLTADDLNVVMQAVADQPDFLIWRGTGADGAAGHPVVFSRVLFAELSALTGDGGAQQVVRRHAGRVAAVPLPGDHARFDLDTPEAWAEWRQRAGK